MFKNVAGSRAKSSLFDLSHERKQSMDMGILTPCLMQEVIPGDKMSNTSEIMARMAPMRAPLMHRVNIETFYFFVPNRLVWNEWEKFITGGEDGLDAPAMPRIRINDQTSASFYKNRLPDYFGIPPIDSGQSPVDMNVNAMPFRAYQLIYNEYFRDQTIQGKVAYGEGSGDVTDASEVSRLTSPRRANWKKDYFASALPFTQRGVEPSIPLDYTLKNPATVPSGGVGGNLQYNPAGQIVKEEDPTNPVPIETVEGTESITINELRNVARLQEWLERQARAGSRYIETILSHFGVLSSDARLQRPELLSAGRSPMTISEVLNTTGLVDVDNGGATQGEMAGHGVGVSMNHGFKGRFNEHGYIIGMMLIRPKAAYSQGIHKTFLRTDKYEYAWPEFAHLGEQPILNQELYHSWIDTVENNTATFGYTPKYAEYRFNTDSYHGDMRDDFDFWHLGRIFTSRPTLSNTFLECLPSKRIYNVEDYSTQSIYVTCYNNLRAVRKLPKYATPYL